MVFCCLTLITLFYTFHPTYPPFYLLLLIHHFPFPFNSYLSDDGYDLLIFFSSLSLPFFFSLSSSPQPPFHHFTRHHFLYPYLFCLFCLFYLISPFIVPDWRGRYS